MSKYEQIHRAKMIDGYMVLDISTKSFPNTFMKCEICDFEKWRDNESYGRIYATNSGSRHNIYGMFRHKIERNDYKNIGFHRIALPDVEMVDHVDRCGTNNLHQNLRDGSGGVNQRNRRWGKYMHKKQDGTVGAYQQHDCSKWFAKIGINGKREYLGSFDTREEAINAYEAKKASIIDNY